MLLALTIKNYALIDKLQVNFSNGFTIITGETGAGKSILLGGLSLILGKRADLGSLRDNETKCVVEAVFDVSNYNLASFFKAEDLDYEAQTIIRREILPSGKSRAFVNDSPVNLSTLQALGENLIDIHSQHQTLQLSENSYQFQIIDSVSNNGADLNEYSNILKQYNKQKIELKALEQLKSEATKAHDYNVFLLNELIEANLNENELATLEEEYEALSNIEDIKGHFAEAYQLLADEQIGAIAILGALKANFMRLSNIATKYSGLHERINSCLIEIDDIFGEVEALNDNLDADPMRLEDVTAKLNILKNLMQKHQVDDVVALIKKRDELSEKVFQTEHLDESIKQKETEILALQHKLDTIAKTIHSKRKAAIPTLASQLQSILGDLGMPNAQFNISLQSKDTFFTNGKDELQFLFSANKGGVFNELKKAASGGELSRIMLAIKLILSNYMKLPTIMFDEIDTGVSGEISNKMGDIMLQMSNNMQVFSITHLPQIAAKGHTHFKVYKEDINDVTQTNLVKLNHDARVMEIAQMLGGSELSSSAIAHAKELLN